MSSGTARATQRNSVSKKPNPKQTNKQRACAHAGHARETCLLGVQDICLCPVLPKLIIFAFEIEFLMPPPQDDLELLTVSYHRRMGIQRYVSLRPFEGWSLGHAWQATLANELHPSQPYDD